MSSFWRVGIVFLTFAAHILVFLTAREDFYMLLGLFTGAFWLYLLIIDEYDITDVFYMAIALRVFWLFSTPTLSDDYHRFLWDGEVTLSGKNVYGHTPSDLIVLGEFDTSLNGDLYKQMNSPDYFSVYPPVNQLYFIASGLFTDSVYGRLLTLKILFFLTEFIGLFTLFRLALSKGVAIGKFSLWALNPLVIIEGMGNLHFEVVMLTYVILAVVYFKKSWLLSAIFFGIAISTKLLPLMFLPLLIPYLGWGRSIKYGVIAGLTFLITFLPFLSLEVLLNIWSSIDLYFQSFEFNASIFYIVKLIGELTVGWDIVETAGPIMAGITVLVIASLSFFPQKTWKLSLPAAALIVSTVYLLMSTTVHPWYALIPFGISLFSKHKFPFWWTGLIFLSYSFYINGTIEEKPLFLFIQYGVLFLLIGREVVKKGRLKKEIGVQVE